MCEGKRRRQSKMVWYRNSCHTWKWCCVDHAPFDFSDYHTLRVGGLVFAGVIVFLSIILLAGKSTTTSCERKVQSGTGSENTKQGETEEVGTGLRFYHTACCCKEPLNAYKGASKTAFSEWRGLNVSLAPISNLCFCHCCYKRSFVWKKSTTVLSFSEKWNT